MTTRVEDTAADLRRQVASLERQLQAAAAERDEALERQTATADILKVIASSPTDVQPVFEAIAESAKTLIGGSSATVLRFVGDGIHLAAFTPTNAVTDAALVESFPRRAADFPPFALVRDGQTLQFPDTEADHVPSASRELGRLRGFRSVLFAPLMSKSAAIGMISVTRKEPGAFAAHHVQLLQTFADQAVIAIENARLFDEVQARTRDLTEALQQQTATAEVLKAISRTAFDLDTVLETLIFTAARLCDAKYGEIFRRHGSVYRYAASLKNAVPGYVQHEEVAEIRPGRGTLVGRVALERRAVAIADAWNDPDYAEKDEARMGDVRSMLGVPLMRDGEPIGAFALARGTLEPFTKRQIELVTTFADQAVIAIENARLFGEVQDALQRETASSDILRVISQSPTDARPVFERIVLTAARSLRSDVAFVLLRDADAYIHTAGARPQGVMTDLAPDRVPIDPNANFPSRAILAKETLYLADWSRIELPEHERNIRAAFNINSALYLPLMREGECIGLIGVASSRPDNFGPKEIAQAESFRDQAMIAIENARLFKEVQAKTYAVEEALQDQIATSGVLQAIGASMADAQPVFERIVDSLASLMPHDLIGVWLTAGDGFMRVAAHRAARPFDFNGIFPAPVGQTALAQSDDAEQQFELADVLDAPTAPPTMRAIAERHGNFAVLITRMVWSGRLIGTLGVTRAPGATFAERERKLLGTFADQAVIAIENARLFDEVQAKTRDLTEALQQQTATADVLKVISRSAFDLQTVLDTLIRSASELSGSTHGAIWLKEGDVFRFGASFGNTPEFIDYLTRTPKRPGRGSVGARVFLSGAVENIFDMAADKEFDKEIISRMAARAGLGVPLLRDGEVIGAFAFGRPMPGLYADRDIELIQTFADQAVIAIENVRLFDEVQARTRDLSEALQQQTATADVLKVINASPGDLVPVFEAMLEKALGLCEADFGALFVPDGDVARIVAVRASNVSFRQNIAAHPYKTLTLFGPMLRDLAVLNFPDLKDTDGYRRGIPDVVRTVDLGGARSLLTVPLVRDGKLIGAFNAFRQEVRPFTDKQIAVLQTFAAQAVIAMENARLINETKEALERQTATADILKVIASSPDNVQPVFEAIAERSKRLVDALSTTVFRLIDGVIHLRAFTPTSPDADAALQATFPTKLSALPFGGSIAKGRIFVLPDTEAEPALRDLARLRGYRSMLFVPLMRENAAIGLIGVTRVQPGPFADHHVDLLKAFADQAVIAISNVGLFQDVQARTRDLTEALQMQTATSDVLKVISRSAFDLQAVFNTLVSSAVELGGALTGTICVREGDVFRYRDTIGAEHTSALAQYLKDHPATPGRSTIAGRVLLSGKVERIPDCLADPDYVVPMGSLASNVRSLLGVPLLRKEGVEGAIILTREEPGHFSDRQIEIVQTFADQAVIAIENVRLFDEVQARTKDLQEALQQQTATADVLKVISRSAFDLQTVLDTLISSAVELVGAFSGSISVREGDGFRFRATSGMQSDLRKFLLENPPTPGPGSAAGRVIASGKVECIPDVLADSDYVMPAHHFNKTRALLAVPLLRDDKVEGALVLARLEPGPFAPRQIEIVQTFADQAVIAIENVRLFDEVQTRTQELAASLDDLRKAQDRLIQSEKLASLGQLTAGIAHEIKNPLNFVNNFSALSRELLDELRDSLGKAPLEKPLADEAEGLIDMVASNLDKVVSHGKRADSIVKNMLLHSREGSGERSGVNVNAMVEEALNLAYHGARAEKAGFNVTIAKSLDPQAGSAEIYAQEMTRVLLNLISNGFYATSKRKQAEANGTYEPTLAASTRDLGHSVEIAIRDNGTGIPEEVKAKMFNPFFTTKPAGEGTGLGLSLSHDIVVKQHGGSMEVLTEPGAFTQFTIRLPRAAPANAGAVS